MRDKITLTNSFHNTSVNVITAPTEHEGLGYLLTKRQVKRIDKKLCGIEDCGCGVVRMPGVYYFVTQDGTATVEGNIFQENQNN